MRSADCADVGDRDPALLAAIHKVGHVSAQSHETFTAPDLHGRESRSADAFLRGQLRDLGPHALRAQPRLSQDTALLAHLWPDFWLAGCGVPIDQQDDAPRLRGDDYHAAAYHWGGTR